MEKKIEDYLPLYGIGCPIMTVDGKGTVLSIHPRAVVVLISTIDFNQVMTGKRRNGAGDMHYTYLHKDNHCKLVLRPLIDMTDEEAIEISELYYPLPFQGHRKKHWKVNRTTVKEYQYLTIENEHNEYMFQIDVKECCVEMYSKGESCESYTMVAVIDKLRSWHIDINGLIESGLAINKNKTP